MTPDALLTLPPLNYVDYETSEQHVEIHIAPCETAPVVDVLWTRGEVIRLSTIRAGTWGRTLRGTWVNMDQLRLMVG